MALLETHDMQKYYGQVKVLERLRPLPVRMESRDRNVSTP